MAQDIQKFMADLDESYAKAQKGQPDAQPNAAPASSVAPVEEGSTVGGFLADTGKALAGGIEAAGRGILQTGVSVGNAILRANQPYLPEELVPQLTDVPQPTFIAAPDYAINKVVKDVTQFGLGFLAGGPVMKGLGVGAKALGTVKGMTGQSALGTGLVSDPHSDRISNLVEQYPFLSNPLTRYMASDPTDSAAAGKLKAALEDAFTAPVAVGLFKAIHYGYKSTRGLFKGKEAEEAATDLTKTLTDLNEAAEAGTIKAEKYEGSVQKTLELDPKNPTAVLTMPHEKEAFDAVEMKNLVTRGADHAGPIVPEKVEAIRQALRDPEKVKKLPPISVEQDAAGTQYLVDGRHRVAAAQAEGFTDITAKVLKSKDTLELEAKQAAVGGAKKLDALVAKQEKAATAFNLTPEQYTDFTKKMQQSVIDGKLDELFVEGLPTGAFNYSKMANRGEVHATLQNMADVLSPALEQNVKSYQSFAEIEKTATLFGAKPDAMMANLRTWGVDAKQMPATLLAAKNWAQSLAADIFRDAQAIAITGAGGKTAEVEMIRKISVLADLEGMLKSVQTAAARTTAAGRIRTTPRYSGEQMMKLLDEVGGTAKVSKLAEKLAMTNGKADEVLPMMRASWLRKIVDTHNEVWINALLSGPSTHIVNVSTAALNTFLKPGNIAFGGLIRGDMESVRAGLATWRGLGTMFKDSIEMARRAFQIERPMLSVSDKQLEMESTISAGNYNLNPESWLGQGVNWLGKAARIPSRFLGAEDEFFKQMSYRAKMQHDASLQGLDAIRTGKIKPDEFDDFVKAKFAEGFEYESLPEFAGRTQLAGESGDLRAVRGSGEKGVQYANEATFTQNLKIPTWFGNRSFAETMYQAANSHPVLRGTVLPFVKVPANLLREAASYTPGIAQLRKQFWADLAEGGERASEAIGKMATGSTLLSFATYLSIDGRITGAAPTDPDVRARMYEKGWQPYSFVFGDGDKKTYVPFSRFDPFGMLFGAVGDMAQTFQHIDENSRHSIAATATLSLANLLNSRSYLKGLVDVLDVLSGGQGQDGIDKMNRILNQRAASYIPSITKMANPDSEIKEVRSMLDAVLAKTPGFSKDVPAKRGYFGDKLVSQVGWPWHALLPSKATDEVTDPGLRELARLSDGPAQAQFSTPDRKVGNVDLTKFRNTKGQTAYDRMMEILQASDFHKEVNDLVTSPDYQAGTDGDTYYPGSKQTSLKKLESKYHREALRDMLDEFPDLKEIVERDKQNARNSKRGDEIDKILEFAQ